MTTHELAHRLLAGPDITAVVNLSKNECANGGEIASIEPKRVYRYVSDPHGVWHEDHFPDYPDEEHVYQDVINLTVANVYTLPNGRKYRVVNTGLPYKGGEYPENGLIIWNWVNDRWVYLEHAPSQTEVDNFIQAAKRLAPVK